MALTRNSKQITDPSINRTASEIGAGSDYWWHMDNVLGVDTNRHSIKLSNTDVVNILNSLGVGGSVADASTTVKGIVEEADNAEIYNAIDTGATGARLFVTPSKLDNLISPDQVQFESNVITVKEFAFVGNTTFLSLDFAVTEIDTIDIETRTAAGTTYTTRSDLTALNTFSESIGASTVGYVRLSANFDALYNGRATALVKSKPKLN